MTTNENNLIDEIRSMYGSVSKMISIVNNEVEYLIDRRGYKGRDRADTLDVALRQIPSKFHSIFFKYHHSTAKP